MDPAFSWIKDPALKNNLIALSKPLSKSEHFEVNANNTLTVVKTEGLIDRIFYYFQKNSKNREVKQLITSTVVSIANELPTTDNGEKELRDLFFNRLSLLSQKVFDRKAFADASIKDKKLLPQLLNEELKRTATKLDDYAAEKMRKVERRVEKTKLALKLGVELKPISAGASGSYFARDYKMKTIGVFKPGAEESTSNFTPKLRHRIKNCVGSFVNINPNAAFWPSSGYVSEKLTTDLANHLSIDVIPRAEVTSLSSKKFFSAQNANVATVESGSYQIFERDTKSADEMFNLNSMSSLYGNLFLKLKMWRYGSDLAPTVSQPDFEMMAITDGLILNKDRHFENWLVKKKAVNGQSTHKIVLIDHQLSFPKTNPSIVDYYYRRHQNKWEILKQAESKFTNVSHIPQLLKGDPLKALLNKLQESSKVGTNLFNAVDPSKGHSQEFAFKQRIAVLLIALEKNITIKEYGALKSIEEMVAFTKNTLDINDSNALDQFLGL